MTETNSLSKHAIAVLMLVFFSVMMSGIVSRTVFERLPHLEDEVAYLFQAKVFARGDIVAEFPTPARPFWQPFVIDHSSGTWFSKYPPGWSAWLAPGVSFGQAWVVNAFFAGLTVAMTYALGAAIFNRDVGLIAATLVAFSPMALLLNGTLMAHTSALFWVTLFMYGYWRITQRARDRQWLWGVVAGLALGMLTINRPLTGVAVAAPFVLWSAIRLGRYLTVERAQFIPVLRPLVALGVVTLVIATAIPFYNAAATGNPTQNLYVLVPGWEYDRVGFGEDYGRSGHTVVAGVQHARYDLSLMAADLFGWQFGTFPAEPAAQRGTVVSSQACNSGDPSVTPQQHLRSCDGYWQFVGLSAILLFPGLLVGFRRNWAWLWVALGIVWLLLLENMLLSNVELWLLIGLVWIITPLTFISGRMDTEQRPVWTWLLLAVAFSVVAVHIAYWIGAQRYSARYYYETVTALALLSALPIAWVIQQARTRPLKIAVYGVLAALCLWSLFAYSVPRISALTGYNRISQSYIEQIQGARATDQPALVIVTGETARWRTRGALMAVGSPYLDSEIVVAWDDEFGGSRRESLVALFPGYEVIDLWAEGNDVWFADCLVDNPREDCRVVNDPFAD